MQIQEGGMVQVPWINKEFLRPALMGPSRHHEEGAMVMLSEILGDNPVYPADIILYIAQHACRGMAMGGAGQFEIMLERCKPAISIEQLRILFEVIHDGYEVIKEKGESEYRYALTYRKLMVYIAKRLRMAGERVPDRDGNRRSIALILAPHVILRG